MAKIDFNLNYAGAATRLPPGKYFGNITLATLYAQDQARLAGEVFMVWHSSYRGPNHVYRVCVHRLPQVKFESCRAVVGPNGNEQ